MSLGPLGIASRPTPPGAALTMAVRSKEGDDRRDTPVVTPAPSAIAESSTPSAAVKSKGTAFDTAFVNHEVEDHQQDIEDAKAMTGAARNAEVKAMLEKELSELQKHLDIARRLVKKGGR